jgi:hypothetical protein
MFMSIKTSSVCERREIFWARRRSAVLQTKNLQMKNLQTKNVWPGEHAGAARQNLKACTEAPNHRRSGFFERSMKPAVAVEKLSPVRLTIVSARMRARRQCSGLLGSSRCSVVVISSPPSDVRSVLISGGNLTASANSAEGYPSQVM